MGHMVIKVLCFTKWILRTYLEIFNTCIIIIILLFYFLLIAYINGKY